MAKAFSFEEGMAELEALVAALEKGEMTLDESFKAYEKGVTESLNKTDITDEVTTQ